MRLHEKALLLERCDGLIRRKATGRPNELAQRLGVSKSTLFEMINLMKDMGGPIEYCSARQCYYYTHETRFYFGFVSKSSDENTSIRNSRID